MQTLNNYVLIKPNRDEQKIKIKGVKGGDQVLYLDSSYNEMENTVIVGNVIAVPEKLIYDRTNPISTAWLTEMELEVGDLVTYYYIAARESIKQGKCFIKDGEIYIYIRYDNIFVAKRNGEVIIPNGQVIVEPERETIDTTLEVPEYLKNRKSSGIGIVRYIGTPNRQHKHEPHIGGDDPLLKKGDRVLLNRVCDIPLEYALHKEFDKDREYYRVERQNIIAVVN